MKYEEMTREMLIDELRACDLVVDRKVEKKLEPLKADLRKEMDKLAGKAIDFILDDAMKMIQEVDAAINTPFIIRVLEGSSRTNLNFDVRYHHRELKKALKNPRE